MRVSMFVPTCRGTLAAAACLVSSTVLAGSPPVLEVQPKAGDPLRGLTPAEILLFEQGRVAYEKVFTDEEGLGPIFNKSGCFSCHSNPLGGWGSTTVTRFGMEDKGVFDPLTELGGTVHQVSVITSFPECLEVIPEEAFTTLRVTNASLAFGLVEAIPDSAIAANADPDDLDGDGISGRVHWVHSFELADPKSKNPEGPLKAGRFGWKSQVATVLTFSADAALNEMGITSRFLPVENAPNGNLELLATCDLVPDPEDGPDRDGFHFIDRVTHFQRYLGPPPQTPRSGMTGEAIFNAIGCAKCHIPEFTTSDDRSLEAAIRGKTIRVYSDFLLHSMGTLADGIEDGDADGGEFRTPTLWNLRTRDPMLHHGGAAGGTFSDRVTEVIIAHGPFGEGAASAAAFQALSDLERNQLFAFLDSLGKLEFDMDGDESRNFFDYVYLTIFACAGRGFTPDDPCAIFDIDQNGVIDGIDFDAFETVYEGEVLDCNNNGMWDLKEIFLGLAVDKDGDGVPDSCVGGGCPGDFNGSGTVDGSDLGILLGAWGTPGADLNGDGTTDGADLGILLGSWGACG